MSVKTVDLGAVGGAYLQGQQNKRRNELLELTTAQKEQEMAHLDDESRTKSILGFGLKIKPFLDAGDMAGAQRVYSQRINEIQSRNGNPSDSMELGPLLQSGDIASAKQMVDSVLGAGREMGYLGGAGDTPSGVREFEYLADGLTDEEREKARRIELGLTPRAMGNASMTIANDPNLTNKVADSEARIAGAKSGATEEAKLEQQKLHLPEIKSRVAEAEREARSNGENLSEFKKAQIAMPQLRQAVEDLRELAPLVTHTYAGRIFDEAVKQTGFGATDGATARAKYIAMIDNQMLPLLKQTFGAAFTVKEGEQLKATMGDPNASPEEKAAQLDAFINQKEQELLQKQQAAGLGASVEVDENQQALEWARQNPNDPRAAQIMQMVGQ
jgi:hypothetical protein